ncbi:MAG: MoaD/ThiS family protein [Candidatus Bathyarchaeota archaeon]|nr:MAG: MoaD/ThiS family protein [Candidatus Bathyarchaeota archaeon]
MEIVVRYITDLREITKKDCEILKIAPTATVDTVLKILSKKYGDRFRRYVYEDGHFRSELHLLVNHKPLRRLQSFDIPLKNNDEITIVPTFFPVSGG